MAGTSTSLVCTDNSSTPPVTSIAWYRNGVAISGATTSPYTFTPTAADKGVGYECRANNGVEGTNTLSLPLIGMVLTLLL